MGMRGVEKEGRHEQMDTEEEVNSIGERGAEDADPIESQLYQAIYIFAVIPPKKPVLREKHASQSSIEPKDLL